MSWFAKMKAQKIETVSKKNYLEPKERLLRAASRNMMLSEEGDAYYRSQLKEKLKGKPRSEWDKIIDDYNHTLKIDNEGNIIDIFDFRAYKDRHYQKDDNFSVLKNGKYDADYTHLINKKFDELKAQNFEANSVEFWSGVAQIFSGLGVYFASGALEVLSIMAGPPTAGTSIVAGTAASVSGVQYGNVLIASGAVTSLSAITKTALQNGEIQVNYSSNYDSWQATKPTSKTFGTVEGKVKGKKGNIRVDAEPHSGKVQIQSGGGKSGYRVNAHRGMDEIVDAASAREWIDDISELNKLSNYEKNQLVKYILKAVKWLKS